MCERGPTTIFDCPASGSGGYCLTKDSLLAQWSSTHLLKTDVNLHMTLEALRINSRMPLHTFDLLEELSLNALQESRLPYAASPTSPAFRIRATLLRRSSQTVCSRQAAT